MISQHSRFLLLLSKSVCIAFVCCISIPSLACADENDARRLVKAMTEYIRAQQEISFDFDTTLEIVTTDNQKLGLSGSGQVHIQKPNKVRARISNGHADIEMVYNSKLLSVLGKGKNVFSQKEFSGNIDALIDVLRDDFDRPIPAGDLLVSKAYDILMEDVTNVKDLGSGFVGGKECDHLAFRKPEVDWQIWIAQGESPHPCKYMVTSKLIQGGPQYIIQFHNWKAGPLTTKGDFEFLNSSGAKRISEAEVKKLMGELPGNYSAQKMMGDAR